MRYSPIENPPVVALCRWPKLKWAAVDSNHLPPR